VCALGAMLASTAAGALTIQLRTVGHPDNLVPITGPGDPPVEMEIWAVVTDGNGDLADDGLYKLYSAFRSSDGGLMLGDLSTAQAPGMGGAWMGNGSSLGFQNDLEGDIDMSDPGHPPAGSDSDYHFIPGTGDGDLDIGHTDPTKPAPPWFAIRHAFGMQFTDNPFGGTPVNEWHVGTLTFTATDWGPEYDAAGQSGVTEIWADPRQYGSASWTEDGTSKINFVDPQPGDPNAGDLLADDGVILYVESAAAAPAGAPFTLGPGGGDVVLDGTASTGSVNWWGWDFDGDDNYEIEGIGEGSVTVSYEDLKGMGIPDGDYTAKMTVGWSASDPINQSTATFGLSLVPEPGTVALLALGLVTLIRRRK